VGEEESGVVDVQELNGEQTILIEEIGRDFDFVKSIGREALVFGLVKLGFLGDTETPNARESSGGIRNGVSGIEFDSQLERTILQGILRRPQVHFPDPRISRRHDLKLSLHLLADLFADLGKIGGGDGVFLEAFLKEPISFIIDVFGYVRLLNGAASDQDFVPQDLLLVCGQPVCPPEQQRVHAAASQGEQNGVERHDAQPFAEPDLPPRNRFHRDDLDLTFLDITREGAASQPERGKAKQTGDSRQSVGDENLSKALGGAVVFDEDGESDHSAEQEDGNDDEEAKAESGFPGKRRNGQ